MKNKDKKIKLRLKSRLMAFMYPQETYLINMELANGMHRTFIAKAKKHSFKYNKGVYVIDSEKKYYNVDFKMYALDYHEHLAVPIDRIVPVNDIKQELAQQQTAEVENSINPLTLEAFLTSRIAEGVMAGSALNEFLRMTKAMILVIMITVIVHLVLFMVKSGMLEQVANIV